MDVVIVADVVVFVRVEVSWGVMIFLGKVIGVWKFSKKLVFNDLPRLYLLLLIPQRGGERRKC